MTSEYDRHNPYAPPAEASLADRGLSHDEAMARLRTPARWLVWMGIVSILVNLAQIATMVINSRPRDDQMSAPEFAIWLTSFSIVILFQPLLVLIAGWKVASGKWRGWVWIAIVAGL